MPPVAFTLLKLQPHFPVVQLALNNKALETETPQYNCSIFAKEMLQNSTVQRLKARNPTGLPSGRLVARTAALNITFKP
jgi:hypothetical protein